MNLRRSAASDAPELPGGERQRVAVARAAANDPKSFLLVSPPKVSMEITSSACSTSGNE
jgi:ABC-type lipoprotein export system ATPase subunit